MREALESGACNARVACDAREGDAFRWEWTASCRSGRESAGERIGFSFNMCDTWV